MGSDRFVNLWFQVLFHSPHRGSFQLSLTVLVRYRSPEKYLALARGRAKFPQGFPCPVVLGYLIQKVLPISSTGLSPSMINLSRLFNYGLDFSLSEIPAEISNKTPLPQVGKNCSLDTYLV